MKKHKQPYIQGMMCEYSKKNLPACQKKVGVEVHSIVADSKGGKIKNGIAFQM